MKLIKVKGIVIKEVAYQDNDKIITILTDNLGKISCMARGAKKIKSPILANSQYLVYSEFVLYKGSKFYYVNSADVINTFYKLRTDFDKLQVIFDLTKMIYNFTDENQDTSSVLKLFLNTVYILEKMDKSNKIIIAIFKIKLFSILGFAPRMENCSTCGKSLSSDNLNKSEENYIHYDYINNIFYCSKECIKEDKRRYIKISSSTFDAIRYVINSNITKIFSFKLKNSGDFETFGQVYADTITNGV